MVYQVINAKTALTAEGWRSNVRVEIDAAGVIATVTPDSPAKTGEELVSVDLLLPALSNLHSHSFQRLLAGLVEKTDVAAGEDDFWTWRRAMYEIVPALDPDAIHAVAAQVQMEMLEAGFAAVGEFHYVHHGAGGAPCGDVAATSKSVIAAAQETGAGLTHLPVLYMRGGMDDSPLEGPQLQFGCNEDQFAAIHEGAAKALTACPADFHLGLAPHSLRAVTRTGLEFAVALAGDHPVHIHIAEQTAEVEAVEAAYGARPVRWLLDHYSVGENWCLVHATHMDADETSRLARSRAVAGLCPLTEANLGDGAFDGVRYLRENGAFGVGSDCNFRISVSEELRMLEYSQRLRDRRRLLLAAPGKSVGRTLYEGAALGGAKALERNAGKIAPGCLADLVSLDTDNDLLFARAGDALLDAWIFAGDDRLVRDVWSAGRRVVREGRHFNRDRISTRFRDLASRIRNVL